jgi:hypothetical protein
MWLSREATITSRRAAAATRSLIVVDGRGWPVAAGEGCGHAGEQQIEEAVQFGGDEVGG